MEGLSVRKRFSSVTGGNMEPVGLEAGNCGYGKTKNFRDCFCVLSEINPPLRARGWKGALEIREVKSEGLTTGSQSMK